MNIFYLNEDPVVAAFMHADKHVVKMPSEGVQLLSTTLRLCDGQDVKAQDPDGKWHVLNMLEGETYKFVQRIELTYTRLGKWHTKIVEVEIGDRPEFPKGSTPMNAVFLNYKMRYDIQLAMAMTHENHPSRRWVGMSFTHYDWLVAHVYALESAWKQRYGHPADKRHASVELLDRMPTPVNLEDNGWMCDPLIAIKDESHHADSVKQSYINYYIAEKSGMGIPDYFWSVVDAK